MPMTLVRHPRVARRVYPAVLAEVKVAYNVLGQVSVGTLQSEISDWEHQPPFSFKVIVNKGRWQLTLKWDRRTKAGKIYEWVSEGTGERGDDPAGTAYIIRPKKAKALRFDVPLITKTSSDSGLVAPSTAWDAGEVITQEVHAPGIFPRHLGKELYEHLRSRRPGSFHNVTEAAIKRAFRKMGIYVG